MGDRSTAWDDLGVAALALVIYGMTLAPGVTTGDSGELITAAATLGLAHPTGYPLYLVLGRLFLTPLWFLRADLAMNLFSAVAAAAGTVAMRRLCHVLAADRRSAAVGALLFAFSASLWSQATTARVYALNVALLLFASVEMARLHRRQGGSAARMWLLCGLALAVHTVSVVLVPLAAWVSLREERPWGARLRSAAWVLAGPALYLYVPIAASFQPYQNWGNPSTWDNLVRYLTRADYWDRRWVQSPSDLGRVVAFYLARIPRELGWAGAALAALGAWRAARTDRGILVATLWVFGSNVALMALHGSRPDIFQWPRYLVPGFAALVPLAALGLGPVLGGVRFPAARAVVAGIVPAVALLLNWGAVDRAGNTLARDFSLRILERVEPGATVFAEGDNVLFPLIYLHHVEGVRPDVTLVLQGVNELSSMPIDPDRSPVYFTHHHNLGRPELDLVPDGLVYRLARTGGAFRGRPFDAWSIPAFEDVEAPGRLRYLDRNLVGDYLVQKAVTLESQGDDDQASRAARRAMVVDFDNWKTFLNAGLVLERTLRFDEALDAYRAAAELDDRDASARDRASFWQATLDRARAASADDRPGVIAGALYGAGRGTLALKVLRVAVRQDPRSFRRQYNLAALLIAAGDFGGARDALEAALVLRPDDAAARRDLEQVRARLSGAR